MRLKDKVAVITGGARGIGRAMAEAYGRECARICVADLDMAAAEECAKAAGNGSFAQSVDVTRTDSIDAMVRAVESKAGGIDILVNNAAIFGMAPVVEITEKSYDRIFAVNVKG